MEWRRQHICRGEELYFVASGQVAFCMAVCGLALYSAATFIGCWPVHMCCWTRCMVVAGICPAAFHEHMAVHACM